jgi:hypothetical protein
MDKQRGQAHHQGAGRFEFRVRIVYYGRLSSRLHTTFFQWRGCCRSRTCVRPRWDARHSTLIISDERCAAEITSTVAADIVHDFLSMFVSSEPPKRANLPDRWRKDEL